MDIAERRTFASTKRSLLALSHAMERSLEVGRPGDAQGTALLIGLFQRPEYFEAERERYARIAADGAVCIVAFAGAVADVPAGVTAVSLDLTEPLASQWALVAIDGALGIALVAEDAQDLVEGETTLEAARLFTARWSFSPGVAGREATRILDSLGDRVDASVRARADAALEASIATTPSLTERRLAAVTELLVSSIDAASHRSARLRAQLGRERTLSETDPLTGLNNRRFLKRYMDSPASHLPLGLASLLIDLDGLKAINDDHGHEAGDAALLLVSDVLRDATRPQDVVVRLGGDEFLVVLPGLGADEAVLVGERIVEQIASSRPADPWSGLRLTASVGVAIVRSRGIPMDSLDEALYTGKRLGGGRVVLAESRDSGRVR